HEVLAELGLGPEDRAAIAPETCPNDIAFVERANLRLEARDAPAPFVDLDAALSDLDAIARLHRAAA
ncbi:glycosyltransferase family 2 protein, partial [Methylobacterium trifolii]